MAEDLNTDPPKKEEPSKEEPPKNEPSKEEPASDVKKAVQDVLKEMGIVGGTPSRVPQRGVDIEAMAEDMVTKAAAKLQKEKELEDRLAGVEQTVKAVTEEVPRKVRRSTKILWGDKP